MGSRGSHSTRKKILIWSSDVPGESVLGDRVRRAGYETVVYPDVHDIVAVCAAEEPDLVILDVGREVGDALRCLERLGDDARTKAAPVLVLTDGQDLSARASAPWGCRVDWIAASSPEKDLLTKIRAMLKVASARKDTSSPVDRDGLTHLFSRRHFDERLGKEIERARRYGRKVSCVLIDVDGLRRLNDRYGHTAGDEVLRALGDILLSGTRCSDIAARHGGEEFAIILPETSASDAGILAERLRRAFEERVVSCGDAEVAATISCGVATYPDHACDAATLLRMADSAVYQAKAEGGNCTVVAFTEPSGHECEWPHTGPTILLVEDNDYNRSVASLVLRASGYEVIEAADGSTAVSLAKEQRPDLVLIDVELADMSGLEATKRMVQMDEMKGVPIVALTARDMPRDVEQLVRIGCRGYIVKPIDTNSLASQVQSYLKE